MCYISSCYLNNYFDYEVMMIQQTIKPARLLHETSFKKSFHLIGFDSDKFEFLSLQLEAVR